MIIPNQLADITFQYHTGPIKRLVLLQELLRALVFQYHTGPIKSYTMGVRKEVHTSFNTTLVQLKVEGTGDYRAAWYTFQYHTGPIKSSKTPSRNCASVRVFQYHTGPIKSAVERLLNSALESFNTTLVQLKALPRTLRRDAYMRFQYHTGPIKRLALPANPARQ